MKFFTSIKLSLLSIALWISYATNAQSVIHSKNTGGQWSQSGTWVGGIVPGATDVAIINGPVTFDCGSTWCSVTVGGLTINNSGSLTGPGEFRVNGNVVNHGSINSTGGTFSFYVTGNVENTGSWTNHKIIFKGTTQNLDVAAGSTFNPTSNMECENANVTVNLLSPIILQKPFLLNGATLNLNKNSLTLNNGANIQNGVVNNASQISVNNPNAGGASGGLFNLTMNADTVIFSNYTRAGQITINGNVIVQDTLTNQGSQANNITINGFLINQGRIYHTPDYLATTAIYVSGSLKNYGYFKPSRLYFTGTGSREVFCAANAFINSESNIDVQQSTAQLNATSDLYMSGTWNINQAEIHLNQNSLYLGNTANLSNINAYDVKNIYAISGSKFSGNNNYYSDTISIHGELTLGGQDNIYSNIIIEDTLTNTNSYGNVFYLYGSLVNRGLMNHGWTYMGGSIQNIGGINCTYIYLTGNNERNLQCAGVNASLKYQDTLKLVGQNVVPNLSRKMSTGNEWLIVMPGASLEYLAPASLNQWVNYGTILWKQNINGSSSASYDFYQCQLTNKAGTSVQSIRVEVAERQPPFGINNAVTMRWKLINYPLKYNDTLQSLTLYYDVTQLNGNIEDSLKVYYSNNGGISWKRLTQGVSLVTWQDKVVITNALSVGYYVLSGSDLGIIQLPTAIQAIEPAVSGNKGNLLLTVYGQGLQNANKIRLTHVQSGNTILSDTVLTPDPGGENVKAVFTFNNHATGKYHVEVVTKGGQSYNLPQAFQLENTKPAEVELYLLGREAIRPGSWQTYMLAYSNRGNIDAKAVPMFLMISEKPGTEIEFINFKIQPHSSIYNSGYGNTIDTITKYFIVDSAFNDKGPVRIYPMYIPVIAANSSGSVTFKIKTNSPVQIQVADQIPQYINPFNTGIASCMVEVLGSGIMDATMGAIPAVGCVNSVAQNWFQTYSMLDEGSGNWGSWALSWGATILDCGVNLSGVGALTKSMAVFLINMKGYADAINDCKFRPRNGINVWIALAIDPNDKNGPSGYTSARYINYPNKINYLINFENIKTATAAAQKVIIRDTLDVTKYNPTTVVFESFGFDTILLTPSSHTGTNFINYYDLRPSKNAVVKVMGSIDTLSGVLEWNFATLDPLSLNETDVPLLGFLPPNQIEPQGQGFVSFSVKPRQGLTHGDILKNKAHIVFDNNASIETNQWSNTLDLTPPTGSITSYQKINDTTILLQWPNASDLGSGFREFYIYISDNGSADKLYLTGDAGNSLLFVGKLNHTYQFTLVGVDSVGNVQTKPSTPNITLSINPSSLAETEPNKVVVFPNPANEYVNLLIKETSLTRAVLYDLEGRKIQEYTLQGGVNTIPLSGVPKGLYVIKLLNKQGEATAIKLIKQ